MAGVADRWLLPVTLLLPLLALGGVTPATLLVAVGCVVTLALTKCWGDEPTPRTRAARVLVSIAWAHAALVGLQLVPLPASVLGAVSPGALSGWTAADTAFGLPTRWHPSTVDPPGTLFALATALTTAAFTDVATRIARNRRGRAALVRAIVIALAVFVAVGLLARLFDRGVAFGLYAPRQPLPSEVLITTTLVNTNHAAAAIAIAPALLFGYAMERSSLGQRILLGVAVVVTATSVVLTLSRGGIVVVAFELAAMAFYASARDRRSRLGPAGFVVGAVAGTVATAALVAGEAVTHEATTGDLSKLEVIRRATHLAAAFPHVGVGRGAFASAFAAHESPASGGLMLFSHAENAPVHLAAELGFIAAVVLLGGLAYVIGKAAGHALRRPTYTGALVAVFGLAMHEQFDFATEYVGVAMLAAALLAVITGGHEEPPLSPATGTPHDWVLCVLAPLAGIALLRPQWRTSLDEDQAAVSALWRDGTLSRFREEVDAAALRHPADPFCALAAGVARLPEPDAAHHVLRAVKLAPHRAITRVWLARTFLAFERRPQAWGEYREAMRLAPKLVDAVLSDVVRFGAPVPELAALTTDELVLDKAVTLLNANRHESDAVELDRWHILHRPPAPSARAREVRRMAAAGDVAGALAAARELRTVLPNDPRGYLLEAMLVNDPIAAEDVLAKGLEQLPEELELNEAQLRRKGARLGVDRSDALATRVRDLTLRRGLPIGRFLVVLGDVELERKRPSKALEYYLDAALTYSAAWPCVEHAATVAEGAHAWASCQLARARLAAAFPDEPRHSEGASRCAAHAASAAVVPLSP